MAWAWSFFGVPLGVLDLLGLLLFGGVTFGYHLAYSMYAKRQPLRTSKGKIHLYRRTWVKRILDRKDFILAVQAVRNLMMSANFLATAALLALSLVFNILLLSDTPPTALHPKNPDLLRGQLFFLAGIFAFALWSFLLSIRSLNQLSVLIAADPDLIAQVEGIDAVTYLTHLLNRATNRYTYGQRAFYFSTCAIAWIFSPLAFVLLTLGMGVFFAGFLDFAKWRAPRAVRRDPELLKEI